ncbi:hypothetical protein ScPMuIL_000906, partial [Solemya velum]
LGTGTWYRSRCGHRNPNSKINNAFPLQCQREKLLVVKTHGSQVTKFEKAILIIRNPFKSFFSFFQFRTHGGHFGYATRKQFK